MSRPSHPGARRLLFSVGLLCALVAPLRAADRSTPATAPAFTLPTANASVTLDSLRGKVVMVDFWASWCGPCHRSFPWMAGMQQKYGSRGLVIVAVNLDRKREAASAFLAGVPAPFTIAYDPAGRTAAAYHVEGMPTTVLVGRDGTVIARHIGFEPAKAADFEALIQEALRP